MFTPTKTIRLIAITALASLITSSLVVQAQPRHEGVDYEKFVLERDELAGELAEWLKVYGKDATKNGWLPSSTQTHSTSTESETQDDLLQRFYLAKHRVEKLSQEMPTVEFSVMSPFSLLTEDEFKAFVGRPYIPTATSEHENANATSRVEREYAVTAESVDWSAHPCNGPVVNQGSCGSCWAFATIGMVDIGRCLRDPEHKRVKFSEQQLVSCDTENSGCKGGWPHKALDHFNWGGLPTLEQYPYASGATAQNGQCMWKGPFTRMSFAKTHWERGTEARLLSELQSAPVVVTMETGSAIFQQYKSGIVPYCPAAQYSDHAVVAVGFDRDSIKIKNSWGSWWGDNGYIRLRRGSKGTGVCGLLRYGVSMQFECTMPRGGLDTWYFNTYEGAPVYGCAKPDGSDKDWVMLNAYREGGIENVHWRYVENNDTRGCMSYWNYYAEDGKTLIEYVKDSKTKTNAGREWCALPVYCPGGHQGYQWDYCSCPI